MKKNNKRIILLLMTVLLTALFVTVPVSAASKAEKNKKADTAYDNTRQDLLEKSSGLTWKYTDLTGDGIHEFIAEYNPKIGGPAQQVIYTWKNGKVKCILNASVYGMNSIIVYKKSKSLIIHGAGHGGEQYVYYKLQNGKYKTIASKGRQSENGGGIKNGPWYYYDSESSSIGKSVFNSLIKGIKKGKKIKLNPLKWEVIR